MFHLSVSGVFTCQGILVVVLFIAMPSLSSRPAKEDKQNDEQNTNDFLDKFALRLFAAVKESGNVIFSPVSLHLDLGLGYAGAEGQTARELRELLLLVSDSDLQKFVLEREAVQAPQVELVTSIVTSDTAKLKENFLYNAEHFFNAVVGSRHHIKPSVKQDTGGTIIDLLEEGSLSLEINLVLLSSISFFDDWQFPFKENLTETLPFHVTKTTSKHTPMMRITNYFPYHYDKDLDAKIVKISYKNRKFAAYFILPNKIEGLKDLEEKLKTVSLARKLRALTLSEKVAIHIPKFKMSFSYDFKELLQSLGIKSMFSEDANFSNMTDSKVSVSKVVQNAFMEVREARTDTVSVTEQHFDPRSLNTDTVPPKVFVADHPFLFLVTVDTELLPLILGRFAAP